MPHRDLLTDAEMADEIKVPVALVAWVRAGDISTPPPSIDPAYDVGLQQNLIVNQNRVQDIYGLLDGTRPV